MVIIEVKMRYINHKGEIKPVKTFNNNSLAKNNINDIELEVSAKKGFIESYTKEKIASNKQQKYEGWLL